GLRARPHLIERHPVMAAVRADLVSGSYRPSDVAELYRFPAHLDGQGQCIGIVDFGQEPSAGDLEAYFRAAGLPAPSVEISSGTDEDNQVVDCCEATMAIEI